MQLDSQFSHCINFRHDLGSNSVDTFWGWDPKEVWALITWLFYAAVLHLRLSKGWHGEKSAWLAVIGFAIIMFNFIVVNLIIAGLHSYA